MCKALVAIARCRVHAPATAPLTAIFTSHISFIISFSLYITPRSAALCFPLNQIWPSDPFCYHV